MNGNAVVKDVQKNRKKLNSFILYQTVKFRQGLDVKDHREGNSRPSISMQKKKASLKIVNNKETLDLRTVLQKKLSIYVYACLVENIAAHAVRKSY